MAVGPGMEVGGATSRNGRKDAGIMAMRYENHTAGWRRGKRSKVLSVNVYDRICEVDSPGEFYGALDSWGNT